MAFSKEVRKAANVIAAFHRLVKSRPILSNACIILYDDGSGGVMRSHVPLTKSARLEWWLEWESLDEALKKLDNGEGQ
jgi:hypothetical protein